MPRLQGIPAFLRPFRPTTFSGPTRASIHPSKSSSSSQPCLVLFLLSLSLSPPPTSIHHHPLSGKSLLLYLSSSFAHCASAFLILQAKPQLSVCSILAPSSLVPRSWLAPPSASPFLYTLPSSAPSCRTMSLALPITIHSPCPDRAVCTSLIAPALVCPPFLASSTP
jgi:hypothetical protein